MRTVTIIVLCLVIVLLWLLTTSPAYGATYYVALSGNDGPPGVGTEAQPWRTIAKGLTVVQAGDTLVLRGGTYTEGIDSNTQALRGGSSWGTATTIKSYPGETAVLMPADGRSNALNLWAAQNSYTIFHRITLDGTGINGVMGIGTDTHHIRFEHGTIRYSEGCGGGYHTVGDYGTGNAVNVEIYGYANEFLSTKIHGSWCGYGFYDGGHSNVYIGNDIYENAGYGIHFYNGYTFSGLNNHVVKSNRFWGNGFIRGMGAMTVNHGMNYQITNNVIYNNYLGVEIDRDTTNSTFDNNTVYNNQIKGLEITNRASTISARNNILYQNAGGNNLDNQGTGTTLATNLTSNSTNPQFVNPGAGDFRLNTGSPAINTGTTLAGVPTDFAGVTRPQGSGYDIGAYEYQEGAGPPTSGNPIYVKKSGADAHTCAQAENPATPKLTIGSAWTCMTVAGKSMLISAGTYTERLDTQLQPITGGTSAAAMTTIQAAAGETVILALPSDATEMVTLWLRNSDSWLHFKDLVIDAMNRTWSNAVAIYGPSHDLLFTNVTMRNATYEALYLAGGTNLAFQAPTIHQATSSCVGIDGNTAGVVFRDGTIHHCTGPGIRAHADGPVGRRFGPRSGTGLNLAIERVRIHDTTGDGIVLGPSTNALVINNVISQNGSGLRIVAGAGGAGISHNTVTANTGRSLQCDSGATSISLTNNIFYGNGLDPILNNCSATLLTNVTTDPLFINAGAKDYRLSLGSPAINGTTLAGVTVDIVGEGRPQGAASDVGAYEFVGTFLPPPSTRVPHYVSHFFVY